MSETWWSGGREWRYGPSGHLERCVDGIWRGLDMTSDLEAQLHAAKKRVRELEELLEQYREGGT